MTRNDKGQFESSVEISEHTDVFDRYAGWLVTHTDSETTVTRRKAGAKAWLSWCEENGIDPLQAGENTVRRFITDMVTEEYAETTISSRFASVSKFYHWILTGENAGEVSIEDNPCADISLPKDYSISNSAEYVNIVHQDGRQDIIAPSHASLKPLFDDVPGDSPFTRKRNELICRLFWQTAVRSDELSRFKIGNIDFDEREIEIRSAKLNREDHPDLYHRKVFYEPHIDYLLQEYLDHRDAKDTNNNPHLLIGDKGDQLDPAYLSRIVKKSAHNANIQEPLVMDEDGSVQQWLYTGHRLRHARITHLCNKTNMDLNFIRMFSGHAQIETTLKYVKADWTECRDAFRNATQ